MAKELWNTVLTSSRVKVELRKDYDEVRWIAEENERVSGSISPCDDGRITRSGILRSLEG
jgi:hypothetical protein